MRQPKIFFFLPVIFLFINLVAFAQSNIDASIQKLINESSLKNASISLCVLKANTGELVYGHNEMQSLKPASTLKVITTSRTKNLYS